MFEKEPKNWIFEKVLSAPPVNIKPPDVKLKIYAAGYDRWAPGYLRIGLPLTEMRKAGLAEVVLFEEVPPKDNQKVLEWCNIIVFHKMHDTRSVQEIQMSHAFGKAVIMDFDDYLDKIYETGDEVVAKLWDTKTVIPNLHTVTKACDAITIASKGLIKKYSQLNPNIYYVPNAIDNINLRWNFTHQKWPNKRFLTIGWHGGSQHVPDIELLRVPITNIMNKYPHVAFKFMGMPIPDWVAALPEEKTFICSRWLPLYEFGYDMADIDIGLIPLAANDFNRYGKSDLKYLDYTMGGAISISTDIGELHRCIQHGINGLLVRHPDQWERVISSVIEDPSIIEKLRNNAVDNLLKFRAIPVSIKTWYDVYREVHLKRQNKWERLIK